MKLPPSLALAVRRTFVTVGVASTIVVGAATVRAAAIWTASSAPLEVPPISASDIAARLSDAAARSAAIDAQIADLTGQTAELAQALAAAEKRVGTDSSTARSLRRQLSAAEKKLAALSKALKASTTHPLPTPASSPISAPTHHPDD